MPSTAPYAESVPNLRPQIKPKSVIEITPARARCEARMRVVYDRALSPGARLLYVALDDYAGMGGEAWPRQATLADRLGCSEVWIRAQLRELEDGGYLRRQRGQRGVRYLLDWQVPTESRVSAEKNPDRNEVSPPTESRVSVGNAVSISEPDQEPETSSSECDWLQARTGLDRRACERLIADCRRIDPGLSVEAMYELCEAKHSQLRGAVRAGRVFNLPGLLLVCVPQMVARK